MINMNTNEILKELAIVRNLGHQSLRVYRRTIKNYEKFNQMSMADLINEADAEEEAGIRWKNRKLKQRLLKYRQYLIQNYKKTTIKAYFTRVLVVYKHFDIEIHLLPPLTDRNVIVPQPIAYKDILTHEEIDIALKNTSRKFNAVILFMASSGCANAETHSISLRQFVDATFEYHQKRNLSEAVECLNGMNDVVPTFYLKRIKTNKYYYTFCSPEAVKSIINFLIHDRKVLENELDPAEKLFNFGKGYLPSYMTHLSNELGMGKAGSYGRLRTHMFRKFHASTLKNAGMSESDIDALQGRGKSSTRASYFYEDPQRLREQYIECLPALSINENVNILDFKAPEYRKLESELESKNKELEKMNSRMDRLEDMILKGINRETLEKINKLI